MPFHGVGRQTEIRMKPRENQRIDPKYVDVLDGIRAVSIIIVLIFHFWQQTWIFPTIKTPFLSFIGIHDISFTSLARVGYMFVDMMVLISGFLLFLPMMRQIFLGGDMIDWREYTKRRFARIAPSYYFAVLVIFFCFSLPNGLYRNAGEALKDLFTHLTFTQTLFRETYLTTKCDVVLWTVAIEVWFYCLFPFFAEIIKKRDSGNERRDRIISAAAVLALFIAFHAVSYIWQESVIKRPGTYLAMNINQLPAFMGAYANGMLGALIYVLMAKHAGRSKGLAAGCTVLSAACIAYIFVMIDECASLESAKAQLWQVTERLRLTAAFMIFILSTAFAAKWYRFLFSNRLMRFLSGISYNLYIWHQWLAVQIKDPWRIPGWTGDVPPNQNWDYNWMWRYAIIITVAAFAVAIIVTYLVEKPVGNLILGKPAFPFIKGKKTKAE